MALDCMCRSIYVVDTYMLWFFGQDFTPSENSDSPRFPIFHNFKSKREIVMSFWMLINCLTSKQSLKVAKHARQCQCLFDWCSQRVTAWVHIGVLFHANFNWLVEQLYVHHVQLYTILRHDFWGSLRRLLDHRGFS
jgi:hypothetical protein